MRTIGLVVLVFAVSAAIGVASLFRKGKPKELDPFEGPDAWRMLL